MPSSTAYRKPTLTEINYAREVVEHDHIKDRLGEAIDEHIGTKVDRIATAFQKHDYLEMGQLLADIIEQYEPCHASDDEAYDRACQWIEFGERDL